MKTFKGFSEFSGTKLNEKGYNNFRKAQFKCLIPFTDALLIRPPRLAEPIVGPFQNDKLQTDAIGKYTTDYTRLNRAVNLWLKTDMSNDNDVAINSLCERIEELSKDIPDNSNIVIVLHWTGNYDEYLTHDMYELVKYYSTLDNLVIGASLDKTFNGTGIPWLNLNDAFADATRTFRTVDCASNGYHASNEAYCIMSKPEINVAQYAQAGIFFGEGGSVMMATGGFAVITQGIAETNLKLSDDGSFTTQNQAWGFQFQARNFYSILQDALVLSIFLFILKRKNCQVLITDHSSIRLKADDGSREDKYEKHFDYGASFSGIWLMHTINKIINGHANLSDDGVLYTSTITSMLTERFKGVKFTIDDELRHFGVINPITEDIIGFYSMDLTGLSQSTFESLQKDIRRSLFDVENKRKTSDIIKGNTVYLEVPAQTHFHKSSLFSVIIKDKDNKENTYALDILFDDSITYASEIIAAHAVANNKLKINDVINEACNAISDIKNMAEAYMTDNEYVGTDEEREKRSTRYNELIKQISSVQDQIKKSTSVSGIFSLLRRFNAEHSAYYSSTEDSLNYLMNNIDDECVDPYEIASPPNRVLYGLVKTVADVEEDVKATLDTVFFLIDFIPLAGIISKLGAGVKSIFKKAKSLDEIVSVGAKQTDSVSKALVKIMKSDTLVPVSTGNKIDDVGNQLVKKNLKDGSILEYSLKAASVGALSRLIDNGLTSVIHSRFIARLVSDFIANFATQSIARIFENGASLATKIARNANVKIASGLMKRQGRVFMKMVGWPVINVASHVAHALSTPGGLILTGAASIAYYIIGEEVIDTVSGVIAPKSIDENFKEIPDGLDMHMTYINGCKSDTIVTELQPPEDPGVRNVIDNNTTDMLRINANLYEGFVIRGDNSVLVRIIGKNK